MLKPRNITTSLIISSILWICLVNISFAQSVYIQKETFIIPWGDGSGALSLEWRRPTSGWEGEFISTPGPAAANRTGGFVIGYDSLVLKYSLNGVFVAETDLSSLGIGFGFIDYCSNNDIDISTNGKVCISNEDKIYLFDGLLNLQLTNTFPGRVSGVTSSDSGGFWIRYTVETGVGLINDFMLHLNNDSSMSEPVLIYSGGSSNPQRQNYIFVAPNGTMFPETTDKYGYIYLTRIVEGEGEVFTRYSPTGQIVYEHPEIQIAGGWANVNSFYPTWSGDFFSQHGTPDGLIITRFELNLDPICSLVVVTPIPLQPKPAPFAVEFDASGTTDPNGDNLTYEWSFDGDLIFNEPVDDAYTGDPDHPTHLYYEDYNGPVIVRVKDPYDGECQTSVTILIDIE